jgi:tetratricopeptide (TPR) repeat protein
MEVCNRVILDEPDNPGALYVIGCVLLKAARQVQAIQIAKRITHLCPNDFRGWSLLALCWGELCRYDESIRNAEKALKCSRTDKTLSDLAYAHTNAGNEMAQGMDLRRQQGMGGRARRHRYGDG